jgi:hypothetical protein
LTTEIGIVALDATRLERAVAVNSVELTNVVVSAVVFHKIVAPERKPLPFTSNVKSALPAVTLVGEIDAIVGGGPFTAIEAVAELPPPGPGLLAITEMLPAVARSVAVNAALT